MPIPELDGALVYIELYQKMDILFKIIHILQRRTYGIAVPSTSQGNIGSDILYQKSFETIRGIQSGNHFVDGSLRQLRLSLNMPFSEINDPRNLCINVAGKGRWGNGEVEVKLRNEDEIPYVLGLIRQSLERQMGND